MLSYLRNLKSNELVRGSFILMILTVVSNIFSYLLQLFMARKLGPADYGIFAVLTGIMYIFTIPTASIQTVVSKHTTDFNVCKEYGKIKGMLNNLLKKFAIISILFFIAYAVICIFASSYLNISYWLLLLTGFFIFSSFLYPIVAGIVQGMKKFFALGFNGVLNCGSRLLLGVILVFLGLKVYGAVTAFIFGFVLAILLLLSSIREIRSAKSFDGEVHILGRTSQYIFWAMIPLVLLYSIDVIFARLLFDPEIAGKYAVISMIGKIILFVLLSISTALLPINSEKSVIGRETKHVFRKAMFISLFLSTAFVAVLALFPKLIISILFGAQYLSLSGLLIYLSIAFSLIALLNLITINQIAVNKFGLLNMITLFAFLIIQIVLFFLFSNSIENFSRGYMISSIIAFIGGLLWLLKK